METEIIKHACRKYVCPACKTETMQGTNHLGEIYVPCKICTSSVLYCAEPGGEKQGLQSKASLIYYRFSCREGEDAKNYADFLEYMEELGYRKWERQAPYCTPPKNFMRVMKEYHDTEIIIYEKSQFADQYVSSVGRIHDWEEMVYLNPTIREGYYLIHE